LAARNAWIVIELGWDLATLAQLLGCVLDERVVGGGPLGTCTTVTK
jgi:hypothetical protein